VELAEAALFYYQDVVTYEEAAAKKFLKSNALEPLNELIKELEAIDDFSEKSLEGAFLKVMETTELKLGKIAQPVRVALTGRTASPGIFEIIEILGKDAVLSRLNTAVQWINGKN
jgi:glutamyl-tRNA synthetase